MHWNIAVGVQEQISSREEWGNSLILNSREAEEFLLFALILCVPWHRAAEFRSSFWLMSQNATMERRMNIITCALKRNETISKHLSLIWIWSRRLFKWRESELGGGITRLLNFLWFCIAINLGLSNYFATCLATNLRSHPHHTFKAHLMHI